VSFTAFALLHGAAARLGPSLSTRVALLDPARRAAWSAAAAHLVYSLAAGGAGAAFAAAHPEALSLTVRGLRGLVLVGCLQPHTPLLSRPFLSPAPGRSARARPPLLPAPPQAPPAQLPPTDAAAASALTTAATGFFAFRLWLLVRARGSLLALAHYTLLLLLYGVASCKGAHAGLLAAALACELAAVPALWRRVTGARADAGLALERLTFLGLRWAPDGGREGQGRRLAA
jgi:hypothetical protein